MFTIEIVLANFPLPVSVQRKTEEDARALYDQLRDAMNSGNPKVMELTCDRQPEKKVSVAIEAVRAVQMSQKDGATRTGNAPGFFAAISES